MNQQHYPGGIFPSSSSEPSMKRRRGRPRKEDTLVHHAAKLTPIQPSLPLGTPAVLGIKPNNQPQSCIPSFQRQPDLSKGKARVEDVINPSNGGIKDDEMIGKVVTGVLEGMFDAGYLLSVKVGDTDMKLRGLVFQPGKFVPVTAENDIAPGAKMYSRIDVPVPGLNPHNVADVAAEKAHGVIAIEPEKIVVEKTSNETMGCESSIMKEGLVYDNRVIEESMKDVGNEKHSERIIVEEPSEVFMECEGFVEEKVVDPQEKNEIVEQKLMGSSEIEATPVGSEKVIEAENKNGDLSSPRLELALSNSTFDIEVPMELSKPVVEANLELDEGRENPQQTLELLADTAVVEQVTKMSSDANEDVDKGNKEEHSPIAFFSSLSPKEIGLGHDVTLEPLTKKQKIDETMNSSEIVSSEPVVLSEAITAPKEVVDNRGFINLACSLKPMETD